MMNFAERRQQFINRTARKPEGPWAVKSYNEPRAHYRSFRVIMDSLKLSRKDSYCEVGCGGGVLLNMAMERAGKGKALDHSKEIGRAHV